MMIRKILTTLMCLLLALALPLSAMAATEVDFGMTLGDELGVEAGVKDLVDAFSLRLLMGDGSGLLGLSISDEELLSFAAKMEADGIYVQSEALGENAFYFSKDDILDFVTNLMKQSEETDAEEIELVRQSIEQSFASFGVLTTGVQSATSGTLDEEQLKKQLDEIFQDEALMDYIAGIIEKTKVTDGEFTAENRDPATQKTEVEITNEDLVKLADSSLIKNSFASEMRADGAVMSAEEASATFKEILEQVDYSIPVTVYTADEGKTLVGIDVAGAIKGTVTLTDDDGKTESTDIDAEIAMQYNRLSSAEANNHEMTLTCKQDEKEMLTASSTIVSNGNGGYTLVGEMTAQDDDDVETFQMQGALNATDAAADGWLGLMADEKQITFTFDGEHAEHTGKVDVSLYLRNDAASIIELSAADRPMITFHLSVDGDADTAALDAVNNATVDTSTQLLQMTKEEQTTALMTMQTGLVQSLASIIGKLPASTMQLLSSTSEAAK